MKIASKHGILGYKEESPNSNKCQIPHNFKTMVIEKPKFKGDMVDEIRPCPGCGLNLHIQIHKSAITKLVNVEHMYTLSSNEVTQQ